MRNLRKNDGFTLIELMIVVVIIGILAAIAIPKFSQVSKSAKEAEAGPILKQICTLAATYQERRDVVAPDLAALVEVGWDVNSAGKYYNAFSFAAGLATATSRDVNVAASKQLNCNDPLAVVVNAAAAG
jgi:prepilin-type N-terminal cleavage/methylation domain-containing protein